MDDARYVCVRMARRPASMGPRIVGRRRHARGQRAHLRALRRRHPPRIRQCFRGCASERARLESEPSEVLIPLTSFVSVRDRKKQENLVDKNYPLHPETVSGTSKQNSRVDSPATEPCKWTLPHRCYPLSSHGSVAGLSTREFCLDVPLTVSGCNG